MTSFGGAAVLVCADDVETRTVEWLWPGRVPIGKVTLLAGDPGLGKSYITLGLAAEVSTGKLPSSGQGWGDGEGHDVFLLSAEDDPSDTVKPRLERMHADLRRVHIIRGMTFERETGDRLHLARLDRDLRAIAKAMNGVRSDGGRPKLLVIDPISAFMGERDSHNNAEVRQVLSELHQFAEQQGVAVLCVTHLSKGGSGQKAVYRAMGSLAFTAAARVVLLVAKHPDDPTRRVVAPVKCNIGKEAAALSYRIEDDVLRWDEGELRMTADELEALSATNDAEDRMDAVDEAEAWLTEKMTEAEDWTLPASVIMADAERDGISRRTLQRAKRRLDVRAERKGSGWTWRMGSEA